MQTKVSARLSCVREGSPAAKAGLRPGDELLAVNSRPVLDVFDYAFRTAEPLVTLTIRRDGRRYACFLFKNQHEDLGLEFEEDLFDGLRTCANDCVFCFVQQSPTGLRESLRLRDDDYRLSFAHGNYITLTNLTDEDMDRICAARMGRLYVSVHTTDPDLRVRMMRSATAGRVMEQLSRLAEAGIYMHAQIVVCPGLNDGEHLSRTVSDLASLHPWVQSIAVVPVGLTKYRRGLMPMEPVEECVARQVVAACTSWRREFLRSLGTRLVFPSDEFYILAGKPFPSRRSYEGFPQLEDGVGFSRLFLDTLTLASRSPRLGRLMPGDYVLVTGELPAPYLTRFADLLNECPSVTARVCIVPNRFWGKSITVAGLLTGQDIADSLSDAGADERVLIPDVMLKGGRFLDDMTVMDLRSRTAATVMVVPTSPTEVLKHLASSSAAQGGA